MTTPSFFDPKTLASVQKAVAGHLARRYRDPQLAEELASEVLSQAFEAHVRAPGTFRQFDLFRWCLNRATWRAKDRLRRSPRQQPLPDDIEEQRGPRVASSPEERWERVQKVGEVVARLPRLEQEVVRLVYLQGFTDREAGKRLFPDAPTLQAGGLRVWRLRQRLQPRLAQQLRDAGLDPYAWGHGGQPA